MPFVTGIIENRTDIPNRSLFCLLFNKATDNELGHTRVCKNGHFISPIMSIFANSQHSHAYLFTDLPVPQENPYLMFRSRNSWELPMAGQPAAGGEYVFWAGEAAFYLGPGFSEKLLQACRAHFGKIKYEPTHIVLHMAYIEKPVSWIQEIEKTEDEDLLEAMYAGPFGSRSDGILFAELNDTGKVTIKAWALAPKGKKLQEVCWVSVSLPNTMGGNRDIPICYQSREMVAGNGIWPWTFDLTTQASQDTLNTALERQAIRVRFQHACDSGLSVVCQEYLAKELVSPSARDDCGYPFLIRAIQENRHSVVRVLLDAGAEVSLASPDNESALNYATSELGYVLDDSWRKPEDLKMATATVMLLLEKGAVDTFAFWDAFYHEKGLAFLLDNGLDPSFQMGPDRISLLMLGISLKTGPRAIRVLINKGAKCEARDRQGRTALQRCEEALKLAKEDDDRRRLAEIQTLLRQCKPMPISPKAKSE
jgi:hypothetical protein